MGLKKNILYSGFLTTSLYIFQLITYPYVARTLGVNSIGICNFVQSIVQYFSLFSMLGISNLGVREIAKCNGDSEKLNKIFSQLFSLNFYLTIIVLFIYILSIELVPQFHQYRKLLYIGASQLFFNTFAVEWLFRGLEEFKYITIRTLLIRVVYVVSIFLFIHGENDYTIYFIIYSGMIMANGIINWSYGTRFVHFSIQPLKKIWYHIRSMFFLGAQTILASIYTTFNIVYLGIVCNDTEVGYYTTATKIENIILALYSSFTLVMMPRISSLMEKHERHAAMHIIQQSFGVLFAFIVPCIFFVEFYAKEIIMLIAGPGYEGAVLPMRIVMPLMLIIGIEQILIVQILMPSRADKQVFINSMVGAFCGIILNILLVSKYQSIGSSIVWLISELAVMLTALYFVHTQIKNIFIDIFIDIFKHFLWFVPSLIVFYVISIFPFPSLVKLSIGVIAMLLYSHIGLYYFIQNRAYKTYFDSMVRRIKF